MLLFFMKEDVVWETLSNIEGDSSFINHAFQTTGGPTMYLTKNSFKVEVMSCVKMCTVKNSNVTSLQYIIVQ